jgi:hypothetical protein
MTTDVSTPTVPPAPPIALPKSLDDLIAEQGVRPLERFENLFGAGRDLWTDDEFAAYLERVQATRREKE